jgi:UDP-N-acetylmuramoyl-tripeptide--D-alanyl-D-alanine ligase
MCAAILTAAGHRVRRSPANYNNEIGLPLSILALELNDSALVVELGMNHPGEILILAEIAAPDVGAITQVAPAHLGPVGSLDAIARAKGELLERIRPDGAAVLNADDAQVAAQAPRFAGRVVWFGTDERAEVRAEEIESSGRGSRFRLVTPEGREAIALECPGRHQVWNALCAVAAARAAGGSDARDGGLLRAAREGLAGFRPVAGRMALRPNAAGVELLDDSYNANPVSTEAALRALEDLGAGRRVAVLGDMLELGRDAEALHERVGAAAARAGVDLLVAVGELSRATARAARGEGVSEVVEVPDAKAAAALVPQRVRGGDAVLVKGSRGVGLERVVAALLGEDA